MELNTHETMKYLTDAERDRFVAFQSLFESDGWRLFKEYAEAQTVVHFQNGANATSWEQSRVALGARLAWDDVANLETRFMNEFEVIAAERAGATTDDPDVDGAA